MEHYGSFPDFIEQINFQVFLKLKHDESKVEHLFVVPGSARQFKIVLVEYPIPQLVTHLFQLVLCFRVLRHHQFPVHALHYPETSYIQSSFSMWKGIARLCSLVCFRTHGHQHHLNLMSAIFI